MKTALVFSREKETKRTWRFVEVAGDGAAPVCGTIYVAKSALGDNPPTTIRVTIESA